MSCDFNRVNSGRDECGLAYGKTEAVSWQNLEPEKSSWAARTYIIAGREVKGERSQKAGFFSCDVQKFAFDVVVLGNRMITEEVIKNYFGSNLHYNLEQIRREKQREKQKRFQQFQLEETIDKRYGKRIERVSKNHRDAAHLEIVHFYCLGQKLVEFYLFNHLNLQHFLMESLFYFCTMQTVVLYLNFLNVFFFFPSLDSWRKG